MWKKKTHEEYVDELAVKNPNVEVIGKYLGSKTKISHKCNLHNVIWDMTPDSALSGCGCYMCKKEKLRNHKVRTQRQYVEELSIVNPNTLVVGDYINNSTSILHKCKIHNTEFYMSPCRALAGQTCHQCMVNNRRAKKSKYHKEYCNELQQANPLIDVVGTYMGRAINIQHKCKICCYLWNAKPDNLLRGKGCPVCSGRIVGFAPEYRNSIWASEYREYFSRYLTEEQMKLYTPCSSKKIDVTCPDCRKYKIISIHQLKDCGLGCCCGDGWSYPNKFVYNVLCQLNLNITPEYSPQWANKKRYDIYLTDYNLIIENHGKQHYTEQMSLTHRTLEDEIKNDNEKYYLAINNEIKYYIVLDCRESSADWIKRSILQSDLPRILHFSEEDIDWTVAETYATRNMVKLAATLFNEDLNLATIARQLSVSSTTIIRWLRKATQIGWCDYHSKPSKITKA